MEFIPSSEMKCPESGSFTFTFSLLTAFYVVGLDYSSFFGRCRNTFCAKTAHRLEKLAVQYTLICTHMYSALYDLVFEESPDLGREMRCLLKGQSSPCVTFTLIVYRPV